MTGAGRPGVPTHTFFPREPTAPGLECSLEYALLTLAVFVRALAAAQPRSRDEERIKADSIFYSDCPVVSATCCLAGSDATFVCAVCSSERGSRPGQDFSEMYVIVRVPHKQFSSVAIEPEAI